MRESKSFTDQEALDKKLIEYIAPNKEDLFRQLEGKSFKRFNGNNATLKLAGEPVRDYRMTLKQRILSYIMDPNVAFILLAIGALALVRGVQSSGRGHSWHCRRGLHSAGGVRSESYCRCALPRSP